MKNQIRLATLSLLVLVCFALAVVPASAQMTLYDNGPVNGQVNAWTINNGFSVSDSFTVSTGSNDSQINGAGRRQPGLAVNLKTSRSARGYRPATPLRPSECRSARRRSTTHCLTRPSA